MFRCPVNPIPGDDLLKTLKSDTFVLNELLAVPDEIGYEHVYNFFVFWCAGDVKCQYLRFSSKTPISSRES